MYYELVFKTLNKNKVKYLIAGGMAVNLHGIPRFTKDLDILIDQSLENLNALAITLKKLNFKPKAPVNIEAFLNPANWKRWNKEKGMRALNFYNPKNPYEEIDLLIYTSLTYEKARKRKKSINVGSMKLNVVSLQDLIKMKQAAGREQDRADIESIRKVIKARKK